MRWTGQAIVYGPPASMGSKKAFVVNGRAVIVDDKKKKLRSFQSEMKDAMRENAPEEIILGPVSVILDIWLARPKSHYGTGKNAHALKSSAPQWPTVKPDADKVLRAVADCGTGIWWKDDSQLASVWVRKHYTDREEKTVISAEEMAHPEGE